LPSICKTDRDAFDDYSQADTGVASRASEHHVSFLGCCLGNRSGGSASPAGYGMIRKGEAILTECFDWIAFLKLKALKNVQTLAYRN
jgi:hypothetical protein